MIPPENRPPALAEWILKRVFSDQWNYTHLGDFQEGLEDILERRGPAAARAWYWAQTIKSLPGFISSRFFWSLSMLRNYLVITYRNIVKNKVFSLINVAGLAAGLAGVILILGFVRFELSYDRFHEKSDRIYRVLSREKAAPGTVSEYLDATADPLAAALRADIPEVVRATRIIGHVGRDAILQNEEALFTESGLFADGEFLKIFSFPLLRGDRERALTAAGSIVLTETTSRKLFGPSDPIGKAVRFRRQDDAYDLTVTGIVQDVPANSHLRFSFLASLDTLRADDDNAYMFNTWRVINFVTYAELNDRVKKGAAEARLPEFMKKNVPEDVRGELALQPLSDIHLRSRIQGQLATNNQIQVVRLFSAIALVLLLIAVVNYVNLATSRSTARSKEIGVRKVTGAHRYQLFQQFIGESLVMSAAALVLALVLVRIAWPHFKSLVGIDLEFRAIWNPQLLTLAAGTALMIGLLAGFYPALVLSSLHPVRALRDFGRAGRKGVFLRKTFVVFQFGASVVLLAGTIVIGRQMNFIQSQNVGYDRERVLTIPIRERETQAAAEAIRSGFQLNPDVIDVSVSSAVPTGIDNVFGGVSTQTDEGVAIKVRFSVGYVDEHYLSLYKIGLAQGRNIAPGEKDVALVNESLVKALGWKNPLGKIFDVWGEKKLTIVGVVKDFHFASLHTEITPLALFTQIFGPGETIAVRIGPGHIAKILAGLKKSFEARTKAQPFEYAFLDDIFDALYKKEVRTGRFFRIFALLAVFVASLGLAGLTALAVERRTKEVGVRKVLGASAARLTALLNSQFIVLVLLANVIALPLSYFALNGWLRNFAYRIRLSVWPLLLASLAVFVVALATISFQTAKAASRNPVNALRYE